MMPIHPACTASYARLSLCHTAMLQFQLVLSPPAFLSPRIDNSVSLQLPQGSHSYLLILDQGSSPAAADIDPVTHGHKPMYILCSAGLIGKKLWLETEERKDKDGRTIHLRYD